MRKPHVPYQIQELPVHVSPAQSRHSNVQCVLFALRNWSDGELMTSCNVSSCHSVCITQLCSKTSFDLTFQQRYSSGVCSLMHTATRPVSSSRTLRSFRALTVTNVHIQNCNFILLRYLYHEYGQCSNVLGRSLTL